MKERKRERARKENEDIQRKKHGIYSRNGKKTWNIQKKWQKIADTCVGLGFPDFPVGLGIQRGYL